MNKIRRVTIKQVAETANVSIQTVSRVLNNRPDVSPATRATVLQVIDQLGYQPSNLARGLSSQRTYNIGVVIAGLDFTGPSKTLNGIAEATEDLNYTLIIKELHHFEYNVQPVLNWLHARHVDGIIWAVPEYGNNREWLDEYLPQTPVPIVFHDMAARPDTSIVYMDNYAGAEKATRHLLHQGYSHIGHISGSLGWYAAAQRKQAWQDTLAESGINLEERFWIAGDWSLASGASVIAPLLDQFPEMEAVFIANDQMAIGALQTLCKRGIQVPQDLALVGYDDIPEVAYICPPLTTVRQEFYRYGYSSVSQLIELIEATRQELNHIEHKFTRIEPELIIRESSVSSRRRR